MNKNTGPDVSPGRPLPLGAHDCCDGFNFAVFSRHAERVELLLFEGAQSIKPSATIDLDPKLHRTGDIWHVLVGGIDWGQPYAYRMHGPSAPEQGHRFDGSKDLLDPYARAVFSIQGQNTSDGGSDGNVAGNSASRSSAPDSYRSLLVDRRFDWQGTSHPKHPWSETIIYETHVRGLTFHDSALSTHPGTFLGIIEKIPYFRQLGITALELMPVHEFDVGNASGREQYWGYNTLAFSAPHQSYSTGQSPGCQVDEFKTMVRELHRANIEVILDVVFNHTAEGDEHGPTWSFRGLDNSIYYMLEDDRRKYRNLTGCGNTLNCNHPVVRDYVIDCLRYWITEMQVDGFRFDLASILGRDQQGNLMANAPLLERIAEDPILRAAKLIAEAWDAAGAYQVGSFSGQRWAEWNGRYRDDIRRFWRGDAGMSGALAARLCGSADLYQRSGKEPVNSINFVTCHDGFTLNDLVSYSQKHNEANGGDNRDGSDDNLSANYGVEGPTEDRAIEDLRVRQIKNMLGTLLVSRGVPMLLGGDEFRRTQRGNNNAYCQDNELSWYDWRLLDQSREIFRFVTEMIALRRRQPIFAADAFYSEQEINWFGPDGRAPRWEGQTRSIGCVITSATADASSTGKLCLLFNADEIPVEFALPVVAPNAAWHVCVDTANAKPDDIFPAGEEPPIPQPKQYPAKPRSLAILLLR